MYTSAVFGWICGQIYLPELGIGSLDEGNELGPLITVEIDTFLLNLSANESVFNVLLFCAC